VSDAKPITVQQALQEALDEAMAADPRVIILGEDIADNEGGGALKVTKGLSTKYGVDRVRSTPIAEQAIVGAAVGAALGGLRPVAEIMLMNFTTVAMDQIINHAAKLRFMSGGQTGVPLVIRTMSGAGFSTGGQHADMLEAWFAHTPGLKVVLPSNPADAKGLLLSAIEDEDPVIFVESLPLYMTKGPPLPHGERVPLGKARVAREGSDVSIVTYSRCVLDALKVAEKLEGEGVSVEVIDLRTIAPLDIETVTASVAKTRRAVVVHEAVRFCGVGAEVASQINERLFGQLEAAVERVGGYHCAVPFSKPLESEFIPHAGRIEEAVRHVLN
jgi:acetoin:2,6-dichlorophenolindophenol oxidoreductase subunit beta